MIFQRLLAPPSRKSFFLFGPRGTGKSTWIEEAFPQSALIDLLEDETFNRLLAHPQDLLGMIPKEKQLLPVVIDEVQKVPALLDEVHRCIEKSKMTFVLTGSSARKLRRGGSNLLAGRALTLSMFPLSAQEVGSHFKLEDALRFGMLPGRFHESDPRAYLESYVATYLREEVQQEGLTRNLAAFRRFLEAASFAQAMPLVVSNVATDAMVERKTVEEYFAILEDLMIGTRIPVFAKRAKRELLLKTKFFFFDAGVYRAIRPKGPLDSEAEAIGPALETLVFNELRILNSSKKSGYEFHYWRTKSKHEVDFVLYGEAGLIAFEVKASSRMRAGETDGLKLFLSDYPMAKAYLIYLGNRRYHVDGIEVIPAEEFFSDAAVFLK